MKSFPVKLACHITAFLSAALMTWNGRIAMASEPLLEIYVKLKESDDIKANGCESLTLWRLEAEEIPPIRCDVMRNSRLTLRLRWSEKKDTPILKQLQQWKTDGRIEWFEQLGEKPSAQSLILESVALDRLNFYDSLHAVAPSSTKPHFVDSSALKMRQLALVYPPLKPVVVAVIDSGVNFDSLSLINLAWRNSGEIPGNGIDDDENGYVDDESGWDFVDEGFSDSIDDLLAQDNDPKDFLGHGTAVASIISATLGTSASSVVKIMPIRVASGLSGGGSVSPFALAEGIRYAAHNGAGIINLSIAGTDEYIVVKEAVNDALTKGVTIVAAAGNSGSSVLFPARMPGVIAVGAIDRSGAVWSRSARGEGVDVFFQGTEMLSSFPWLPSHLSASGTSFAAPGAAARIAVIRAISGEGETLCSDSRRAMAIRRPVSQAADDWIAMHSDMLEATVSTFPNLSTRWRDTQTVCGARMTVASMLRKPA